jgi:predicted GNAT family N-acyltransferase
MRVETFGAGDERLESALTVRRRVFIDEQGVPESLEIDEHDTSDPQAVHVVASVDGEPVAAGRFYVNPDGSAQIGRMAVLAAHRGRGTGGAVLRALLEEAQRRGLSPARLHAQLPAAPFYARHGFCNDGERMWDAGIYHQPMVLALRPGGTAVSSEAT